MGTAMTWDPGYGLLEAAACLKSLIKEPTSAAASASASAGSQDEEAQPSKARFIWTAELEEVSVRMQRYAGRPQIPASKCRLVGNQSIISACV
jgi:hypothetical protein